MSTERLAALNTKLLALADALLKATDPVERKVLKQSQRETRADLATLIAADRARGKHHGTWSVDEVMRRRR